MASTATAATAAAAFRGLYLLSKCARPRSPPRRNPIKQRERTAQPMRTSNITQHQITINHHIAARVHARDTQTFAGGGGGGGAPVNECSQHIFFIAMHRHGRSCVRVRARARSPGDVIHASSRWLGSTYMQHMYRAEHALVAAPASSRRSSAGRSSADTGAYNNIR